MLMPDYGAKLCPAFHSDLTSAQLPRRRGAGRRLCGHVASVAAVVGVQSIIPGLQCQFHHQASNGVWIDQEKSKRIKMRLRAGGLQPTSNPHRYLLPLEMKLEKNGKMLYQGPPVVKSVYPGFARHVYWKAYNAGVHGGKQNLNHPLCQPPPIARRPPMQTSLPPPQFTEHQQIPMQPQQFPTQSQRMEPQHMQSQQMQPQHMQPQQMQPQQMQPQQMEPQQMEPQQMEPQQMEPQQMEPQQMEPQQMEPQQMEPQHFPVQPQHIPIPSPVRPAVVPSAPHYPRHSFSLVHVSPSPVRETSENETVTVALLSVCAASLAVAGAAATFLYAHGSPTESTEMHHAIPATPAGSEEVREIAFALPMDGGVL